MEIAAGLMTVAVASGAAAPRGSFADRTRLGRVVRLSLVQIHRARRHTDLVRPPALPGIIGRRPRRLFAGLDQSIGMLTMAYRGKGVFKKRLRQNHRHFSRPSCHGLAFTTSTGITSLR